ncbi:MAG: hypothetical protein G3M70_04695 [Candidatus Nitronauta litoralis]|uniref:Uncharacterized protein n=1 Tax=Candidatus Nitronauta litoralis TaxID=2705533 RepID=A0A7T0BUF6_9BACT|nr:MAG: hypothetical protein G3M70_04695 [Candidatus Nitronauta litoralis]
MPSLSGYRIYDTAEPCNYTGQKLIDAMKKIVDDHLIDNGKELNLRGCCVGANGLSVILEDKRIQEADLRRVNMGGNKIGDAGADLLARCEAMAKVKWLEMGGNDLGPEGVRALIRSPHLSKLKTLNFYRNWIRDDGAIILAEENELEKLEDLDLAQNEIGDPGMLALSNSKRLPNLVAISMDNNFGTREGREQARVGSLFSKLESLNL